MVVGWIRVRLFNIAQEGLVVKNDAEKRTVNLQRITGVIINESQFSKPIHEKANP